MRYVCQGASYESMEEAWAGQFYNCIDTSVSGSPNEREKAAVRMAYGKEGQPSDVVHLYSRCGANNPEWPLTDASEVLGQSRAKETQGAAMLCPNHPRIANLAPALAASNVKAEADKNKMEDGTHVVGKEVRPGTYFAEPSGACYWERTDARGQIIANNFSNGARVEFTIKPTDYSVSVSGCGEWRRLN